jgi:NMD protein affecting ribosome stability and mRNA decay
MKPQRSGFRVLRREQLLLELVHDSYKLGKKLAGPTRCPECGAVFHKGRWTWDVAPPAAAEHRCPACSRVHDQYPAGYVKLDGEFLHAHNDEILSLIRKCETGEKAEHPLERIMAIEPADGGLEVTTTGTHLAREIAERVHRAYKGELEFSYNRDDDLLRAAWRR